MLTIYEKEALFESLDAPFAEMLAPRPVIALSSSPVAVPFAGGVPTASAVAAPDTNRPVSGAPLATAVRAPASAPAVGSRAPRIEVDPAALQD